MYETMHNATPEQILADVDRAMRAAEKREDLLGRVRLALAQNSPETALHELHRVDLEGFALHFLACMAHRPDGREHLKYLGALILSNDLLNHEPALGKDCPCKNCVAEKTKNARLN